MRTIKQIKQFISESKESGVDFREQAFVNFVDKVLDLDVVNVENLGDEHTYMDEFEIIAKSRLSGIDSKYKFTGEHYEFNEFNPKENILVLKEIYNDEHSFEAGEIFYMNMPQSSNYLLTTSLDRLVEGDTGEQDDLLLVVECLKSELSKLNGYEYENTVVNDISSFKISASHKGKGLLIRKGFSNTIQVELTNADGSEFSTNQVIFADLDKNKVEEKMKRLAKFVEAYFFDEIILDETHNVSKLFNELDSIGRVNADCLINGINSLNKKAIEEDNYWVYLLNEFQLGNWETYQQIEVVVKYDFKTRSFAVGMNYLFEDFTIICDSVNEVIQAIESVKEFIPPQD